MASPKQQPNKNVINQASANLKQSQSKGTQKRPVKKPNPADLLVSHQTKKVATKVVRGTHKKASKKLSGGNHYQRIIKTEYLAGLLLMWIYPVTKPGFAANFNKWVSRQIMWSVVFIVLFMMASGGPRVARFSAAFGGLTLLALLVSPYGTSTLAFIGTIDKADIKENVTGPNDVPSWLQKFIGIVRTPTPQPAPGAPPLPLPPAV